MILDSVVSFNLWELECCPLCVAIVSELVKGDRL